jgi:hypothetical protein
MSNPNPLPAAARWSCPLGVIALLLFGLFLGQRTTTAAGGSDSSGYLNSARRLSAGQIATEVRVPAAFADYRELFWPDFQPLGFRATAEDLRMVPTYSTGLPLLLAIAGKAFGWHWGTILVVIAGALGAIVLCYVVGRELGLGRALAASAAATLGVSPIFLLISVQPLSDTLATTCTLAAVWAAARSGKQPDRAGHGWALACGAAFGMAVLVRATNAVLLPALLVFLGLRWRSLLWAALGGIPFAAWLGWYNHANYGSALRSGYYPIAPSFGAEFGLPTSWHFLRWLAAFLPAILLVLPLIALTRREFRNRAMLGLGLWFGAITGVYAFYYFSHEAWSGLRFILPAIPALILAGACGLEAIARRHEKNPGAWRLGLAFGLVVWAVAGSWYWCNQLGVFQTKGYEDTYAAAAMAARERFPQGSLVVCSQTSGAVYYYTDFPVLRWDHINRPKFEGYTAIAQRTGLPIRALVFNVEEQAALQEHCPGNWVQVGKVENIGLWQLEYPRSGD